MRNGKRFGGWVVAAAVMAVAGLSGLALGAEPGTLTVQVDKPSHEISPILYGLMTEEINFAYDGGLYGELIRNRTFQDVPLQPRGRGRGAGAPAWTPPEMVGGPTGVAKAPMHWSVVKGNGGQGTIEADLKDPVNTTGLRASLRLEIAEAGGRVGVANDGFWGIPVRPNTTYTARFYAKSGNGFSGPLTVDIESNDGGQVAASGTVPAISGEWKKYTVTLKTGADVKPSKENRFVISGASKGTVWLSGVSLFPPTYKDRPNGDRVDISQLLSDLGPSFLRFPGGNYLEGDTIATRFDWKKMIGPVEERPGHMGTWQYRSSDGFGLDEFLGWCDDLHMEPVLAVYAGYSLRGERVTGEQLKPFIQDALDEIEYVTGDTSTKWGALRAKNGHPAAFKLRYVEVGNEDNFDRAGGGTYEERYKDFYTAIKAKYPELQIIATTRVRGMKADVQDDHYYRNARQMWAMSRIYDKTDRNGPKIFVGEWATREGRPTPNMNAALGDAAFLTGLERNSDLVVMSCYAPLFVNVSDWENPDQTKASMQWPSDLIGYDALGAYGSPSYYVQKMFIHNKGDVVLPATVELAGSDGGVLPFAPPPAATQANGQPARNPGAQAAGGVFAEASLDKATNEVILKIVNAQPDAQVLKIDLQGVKGVENTGMIETLQGPPDGVNTVAEPEKYSPKREGLPVTGPTFTREFPAHSVNVLRVKVK
jgi:alpha-N-arabinofuranosidase